MQPVSNPPTGLDLTGLVLIGSPSCGPCAQNADWLDRQNVRYRKVMIDGDQELMQFVERTTGQRSVPQFYFQGTWVPGGFAEVQRMVMGGHIPSGKVTQLPPQPAEPPAPGRPFRPHPRS